MASGEVSAGGLLTGLLALHVAPAPATGGIAEGLTPAGARAGTCTFREATFTAILGWYQAGKGRSQSRKCDFPFLNTSTQGTPVLAK